ncbi:unnamed protein product [Camellia sinensis]
MEIPSILPLFSSQTKKPHANHTSSSTPFMAEPIGRTEPDNKRLKYAFDAGFLSGAHPSDTPDTDDDGDSVTRRSSDSESSDSDTDSEGLNDLAASFQLFSESMLRMELAELEMAKAREASRLEAEKRRAQLESELTQMLLHTQLQIASYISQPSPTSSRKRKRSDEDNSSISSEREGGAMLVSLLQCNLI